MPEQFHNHFESNHSVTKLISVLGFVCAAILLLYSIDSSAEEASTASIPKEEPITAEDRDHWAFRPILRPAIPDVKNNGWVRNAVDHFILKRLESAGVQPMPAANRETLIRRLSFDFTGLPPLPEEVDRFLTDRSLDAYERLVERLLASPEYGVRWGQHWLDLARFAETDGFEHDKVRPNAWRYRDWVVNAFNADMPYDEFVRQQLAGDELYPNDPTAAIATGFLLCGPDMPDINLQEERRHTFLNDMTATVSSTLLAMQVGCAQCHDHKFDPISQLDFYRMRAYFDPMEIFREHTIATSAEQDQKTAWKIRRAEHWKQLEANLKTFEANVLKRVRAEKQKPNLRLNKQQLAKHFTEDEKTNFDFLTKQLASVKKQRPPQLPLGRVVRENAAKNITSHIWIRGDFRRQGPEVQPAFLRIANLPGGQPSQPTSQRAALAEWILSPQNPLTTRVIVNRMWQHHFGRGLSTSPSDFGIMGQEPSHSELLDWLATEVPRQNWSLKSMHRLLVNSSTYRQSSRPLSAPERWDISHNIDPDNDLFSRMNRRRLEGEAIRDSMLVASESLTQRRRGPGVRPPLSEELLVTLLKNQWPVTANEIDHRRRSLYLFVRRNLRYPIFDVFDRPDTNQSCPKRNRSTTAPQSLMLLNSELSLNAARRLAGFILKQATDSPSEQIRLCFQRTLSREPTEAELEKSLAFLKTVSAHLKEEDRPAEDLSVPIPALQGTDPHHTAALIDFCLAILNLNEFIYID